MRRIFAGIGLISIVVALGCSSKMEIGISYNPEDAPKISGYKFYSWLPLPEGGDTRINNAFVARHVVPEVDRILAAKGYQVDSTSAVDFQVGYIVTIQDITDIKSVNTYYGYEYGYEGPSGPGYTATYDASYEKGTLIIDVVDVATEQIVWRGTAQARTDPDAGQDKRRRRLQEAVGKVLAEFPPDRQ